MRAVILISLVALSAAEQKRSADAEPFKFDFQFGGLDLIPFGIGKQKFGIGIDVTGAGGRYGVYGDYGAKYGGKYLYPQILSPGGINGLIPGGLYGGHGIGKRSADPQPGIGYGLGGLGYGGLGLVGLGLNGGYGGGYGGYGGLLSGGNYANGYSHSSGYNHGNHILQGIGKHGGLSSGHHFIGKRSPAVDIYPEYHIRS